jgi:hypothetical protein
MNKRKNNDESVIFPSGKWRRAAENGSRDSALVSSSADRVSSPFSACPA